MVKYGDLLKTHGDECEKVRKHGKPGRGDFQLWRYDTTIGLCRETCEIPCKINPDPAYNIREHGQ